MIMKYLDLIGDVIIDGVGGVSRVTTLTRKMPSLQIRGRLWGAWGLQGSGLDLGLGAIRHPLKHCHNL